MENGMIKLPDNSSISLKELERFRKAYRASMENRERFNKWLSSQPSYYDQFNAATSFNDFGEFTLTSLYSEEELLYGREVKGVKRGGVNSRIEFFNLVEALEYSSDEDYINRKISTYKDNYSRSLITTFGEIAFPLAERINDLSNKDFIRLARKYDLSIKYTDSDKYANPFTIGEESRDMFERLQQAIMEGEL